MTDEELQTRLNHSSVGGKHTALQDVVQFLQSRAGTAYAQGRDVEAKITRDLAKEVDEMREKASRELQVFIANR